MRHHRKLRAQSITRVDVRQGVCTCVCRARARVHSPRCVTAREMEAIRPALTSAPARAHTRIHTHTLSLSHTHTCSDLSWLLLWLTQHRARTHSRTHSHAPTHTHTHTHTLLQHRLPEHVDVRNRAQCKVAGCGSRARFKSGEAATADLCSRHKTQAPHHFDASPPSSLVLGAVPAGKTKESPAKTQKNPAKTQKRPSQGYMLHRVRASRKRKGRGV